MSRSLRPGDLICSVNPYCNVYVDKDLIIRTSSAVYTANVNRETGFRHVMLVVDDTTQHGREEYLVLHPTWGIVAVSKMQVRPVFAEVIND